MGDFIGGLNFSFRRAGLDKIIKKKKKKTWV